MAVGGGLRTWQQIHLPMMERHFCNYQTSLLAIGQTGTISLLSNVGNSICVHHLYTIIQTHRLSFKLTTDVQSVYFADSDIYKDKCCISNHSINISLCSQDIYLTFYLGILNVEKTIWTIQPDELPQ